MDRKKKRPRRRKSSSQPQKLSPVTSPPPNPFPPGRQEVQAALDQTAQQVRAAYEERARRSFAAMSSGAIGGTPLAGAAESGDQANFNVIVSEPPVSIVPTVYPTEPGGAVLVQNHITIVQSADFRELNAKLDELTNQLRRSNEISGEVRDQLIAEITAGKALLAAPKPNATLIELLLKRPLAFIVKQGAGTIVGTIATAALALLGKLTGLW